MAASAPDIPGLTYLRDLGGGGFADVFLYQSHFPEREVAVKVLRDKQMDERTVRRFLDEANTMAALEHPYIVRVYNSGLTSDGRPYIEMAYYPEESLGAAVKRGPFSVPDVLKIGVELSSAIETAHRAGLLHRDIKPDNVLRDRFGDPALTDFGIASRLHEAEDSDASLSVPWSPVEVMFSSGAVDQRSDVYSLAATLWHLLVGRSPFEIPGGDNRPTMMMVRARDLPVPSTGRGDVPASLDRLLQQAMSKDKRLRPASAAAFAQTLQAIEQEMRLRPTPFKVAQDSRPAQTSSPAQTASMSGALPGGRADAPAPPAPPAATGLSGANPNSAGRAEASGRRIEEEKTLLRTRVDLEPQKPDKPRKADKEPRRPISKSLLIGALVLIIVAAVGFGVWLLASKMLDPDPVLTQTGEPTPQVDVNDPFDLPPGAVSIKASRSADGANVAFSWDYSNLMDSDSYKIKLSDGQELWVDDPEYTYEAAPANSCLAVIVVRSDGSNASTEFSEEKCA